jgi:2-hydroxychromene-2-carboxylate isomerase
MADSRRHLSTVLSIFDKATIAVVIVAVVLGARTAMHTSKSGPSDSRVVMPGWAAIAQNGHWLGSEKAPVEVVEFADFTCVHCAAQYHVLEAARKAFPDHVVLVFKHFPTNERGFELALASECANELGSNFARFYNAAFALDLPKQIDLTWTDVAAAAGLDESAMSECVRTKRYWSKVDSDVRDASRLGFRGTPSFLVNGRRFEGRLPEDALRSLIIEELTLGDATRRAVRPDSTS